MILNQSKTAWRGRESAQCACYDYTLKPDNVGLGIGGAVTLDNGIWALLCGARITNV